jgi:hypothetical protein
MPLPEAAEELCYGYLEQEHGGWENNDGGQGEFTFNVAERRIELDFNARLSDSVTPTSGSCSTRKSNRPAATDARRRFSVGSWFRMDRGR